MSDPRRSPPIFVVGVPRSGTTMLSAMLAAHPRLACGPETHFFLHLDAPAARGIGRRAGWPRAAVDYLYSIDHGEEPIPGQFGLTRRDLAEALARRRPSIAAILSGMSELYMERLGKRRWVEKTPDHLPHVARIRRHYPDSPIIRIVRDPRAVACSLLGVPWGPSTLLGGVALWRAYDTRAARFFEVDPRCHTLRYEDLVRAPEAELTRLCRAIGEDFDPAMLDTRESARLVKAANEPWKAKVAEHVDASRAEAWRTRLSADDLRLVEALVGDRLRAYGYAVLGFEFAHRVELLSLMAKGTHSEFMNAWRAVEQGREVIGELVAQGARFWGPPGEKPRLSLFLGDPNGCLGETRWTRLTGTAQMAWAIVRRRLGGVPMAWFHAPDQGVPGRCAGAISRLLPPPAAGLRNPEFARPGDPA